MHPSQSTRHDVRADGEAPWGMTISEDGTLLFVANQRDNEIAAYDTESMKVVATVSVSGPQGLSFRPRIAHQ